MSRINSTLVLRLFKSSDSLDKIEMKKKKKDKGPGSTQTNP